MQSLFQHIALIGKYHSPDVADSVLRVAQFLREKNIHVMIEQTTAGAIGSAGDFPVAGYEEIGEKADLAVVLGGDGTMLNAARRLAVHGVPLVGVNQGNLGFLTDIAMEEAVPQLEQLLAGEYQEETRFMLDAQVVRKGLTIFRTHALNDIVVNKGDLGRMIKFTVRVDDEFVYTQRSDGMIITTPTGSTAYALSANGPILHPEIEAIALVPLCPHTLTARPVTLPPRVKLELELLPPHDARVHYDGQTHFDARAGDRILITQSLYRVRFLHPRGYSYFSMLREKLDWSSAPRHRE